LPVNNLQVTYQELSELVHESEYNFDWNTEIAFPDLNDMFKEAREAMYQVEQRLIEYCWARAV